MIGSRFNLKIGRSTVGDILRQKSHWVSLDNSLPEAKRLRPAKHVDLEHALFLWFSDIRARNVPVSDEILQIKARFFGERLEIDEFSYSRGWLQNFKKRFGIKKSTVHGEAGGVDSQVIASGREQLQHMLRDYTLDNIYNIDETGLFYRLEPNTTLATGPVRGTKKCKDRITVALCANASGSDKLVPFVIGKPARPRCFPRQFNVQAVVRYRNNSKAWMTAEFFLEFLKEYDQWMRRENRKVLLLLDNAASHTQGDLELTNVTLESTAHGCWNNPEF